MNDNFINEYGVLRNYDDIFLRTVLVAVSKHLYDIIEYVDIINGKPVTKHVKCFHSSTGDQQYLQDYYLDGHTYSDDNGLAEGSYGQIPRGVFTINSNGITTGQISGGHERMKFIQNVDTPMGIIPEMFSAMVKIIPEEFSVDLEIKTSNETERLKIHDNITENLYKMSKFYYSYKGIAKLPCLLMFPDNINGEHSIKFRTNANDKLPMLKLSLKLVAHRPIIDYTTVMKVKVDHYDNTITLFDNNSRK